MSASKVPKTCCALLMADISPHSMELILKLISVTMLLYNMKDAGVLVVGRKNINDKIKTLLLRTFLAIKDCASSSASCLFYVKVNIFKNEVQINQDFSVIFKGQRYPREQVIHIIDFNCSFLRMPLFSFRLKWL
jgi:hypothetical protein